MTLTRISIPRLGTLLRQRIAVAATAGHRHIRHVPEFIEHLTEVAQRSEAVAERLAATVPSPVAPDPLASFVAGAWHDAGKIWTGDDFHEIASASELLDDSTASRLVGGPEAAVSAVMNRAATAILPHFALHEQWDDHYVPTSSSRAVFVPAFGTLASRLRTAGSEAVGLRLQPVTLDDLILIYCDMGYGTGEDTSERGFPTKLEARWREIERDAAAWDPALMLVLPRVKLRITAACTLVRRLLQDGYDAPALASYVASGFSRTSGSA